MIKESSPPEGKTVNTHAPNIGAPEYIKQKLTEPSGGTNSNTMIVGDFNAPLSTKDG